MASETGSSALRYHEATKHSELSLRMSPHYLDWDNKPSPFKVYKNLPMKSLPHEFPHPSENSLKALKGHETHNGNKPVDLQNLTEILFYSAGPTRKMKIGGETYYMRAASATGALYPIELYIVSSGIPGLEAGIYHFNPLSFALVRIREGDYGPELAAATNGATALSPLTIALTSLAWRNAWKYEARSYRHWFWDGGVIAANLLAICQSESLTTRLVMSFVDQEVDKLLGLEEEKEATVALAAIGSGSKKGSDPTQRKIPELDLQTEEPSREVAEYPIIWETNRASDLQSQTEVERWRDSLTPVRPKAHEGENIFPLRQSTENPPSLKDVILLRGSTRRFAQKPISFEALSTIIDCSASQIPMDFLPDEQTLIEFYLIANDVTGLPAGSYHYDKSRNSLEQLKEGKSRHASGYLCLEQLLFSDASVVLFLMTNLGIVLRNMGNRGYRAAQFEAGVRAGKIYLSAYSLGVGASGSTFYDDAVTEFFSPHAERMSTMIAVGVGVPAYMSRPGRILPQFQKRLKHGNPIE